MIHSTKDLVAIVTCSCSCVRLYKFPTSVGTDPCITHTMNLIGRSTSVVLIRVRIRENISTRNRIKERISTRNRIRENISTRGN